MLSVVSGTFPPFLSAQIGTGRVISQVILDHEMEKATCVDPVLGRRRLISKAPHISSDQIARSLAHIPRGVGIDRQDTATLYRRCSFPGPGLLVSPEVLDPTSRRSRAPFVGGGQEEGGL